MEYDPIKLRLAKLLGRKIWLRRLFHVALDLLFLRAWYVRRELKQLKPRIKSGSWLLDAGMGFGQYSDRMLRTFSGTNLVGLEIDRSHLYGCERYFRSEHKTARIVLGDVQRSPILEGKIDFILCVDVMEHIEDDHAAFNEFNRVLKPEGLFIMHTPRIRDNEVKLTDEKSAQSDAETNNSPDVSTGIERKGAGWQVGEHVRDGYRDDEARERLEAAGFQIVKTVHGYGKAGMTAWTLLQRVPLSFMSFSKLMLLPVALYLIAIFPIALILMWLDFAGGDNPQGGSLLILAQKTRDRS